MRVTVDDRKERRGRPGRGFFQPEPGNPLVCALLVWLSFGIPSALAAPGVTASLDRNTITLGENVTLSVSFENVNPSGPPILPTLPGISVASSGQSSQVSFDHLGNSLSKFDYNFVLVPSQVGDFTIPALPVIANGQQFTT